MIINGRMPSIIRVRLIRRKLSRSLAHAQHAGSSGVEKTPALRPFAKRRTHARGGVLLGATTSLGVSADC